MLDDDARRRFRQRGGGVRAFGAFVADSVRAARREAHARRAVLAPLRRTIRWSALAAVAVLAVAGRVGAAAGATLALVTAVGAVAAEALAAAAASQLVRRRDGAPLERPGLPNHLTAFRLALVAPLGWCVAAGMDREALVVLALVGASDVADGIVARTRGPVSLWGVTIDPLADVAANAVLYATLWTRGFVPGWLVALLAVRYGMLVLGSILLYLVAGPYPFRATPAGKAAGVVQTAAAAAILAMEAFGGNAHALADRLVPAVALAFTAVIVSQGRIGWLWAKRTRPESRNRSSR